MITKLIVDCVPDGECRGFGSANDGAHILGDGVVEPTNNALVDHHSLWIATVGCGGRTREMRADAELSDESIDETPPLGVIGVIDVELNRDVGLDVDRLEDVGGEGRGGSSIGLADVGGGGGVGVDIGNVSVEEGVRVHEIGSRHGKEARRGAASMEGKTERRKTAAASTRGARRGKRGGIANRQGAAVAKEQEDQLAQADTM